MKRLMSGLGVGFLLVLLYFLLWPVEVEPVAWSPAPDRGYTGAFARNDRLSSVQRVQVPDLTGPEDLAADPQGTLYTTSHEGWIARRSPGQKVFERWIDTGGRPLGIDWDGAADRLVVADAHRGLLAVDREGRLTVLADEVEGTPILYADDAVCLPSGEIYFTDASTKFGAEAFGGTYAASLLDIMEHGGHGRLLRWSPDTQAVTTAVDGLQFANGVALGPEGRSILLAETGSYRILRYFFAGPDKGETKVVIDNLPGFPDNLNRGGEGRYWVGIVSGRRAIVDAIGPYPFLRKMVTRVPTSFRPEATRYGHVVAFSVEGEVLLDLQDHEEAFVRTTGAFEHGGELWITSLHEPDLGRLSVDLPPVTTTTSTPG
ncbi:MAG: SMP-30/gluconolactonase/LRE family protein [Myxococcota bacterium]